MPGGLLETALERMAANSTWQGDCLVWGGNVDPKGYGRLNVAKSGKLVHRLSWLIHFGPPPSDKPCVLHTCDNPPCWNPEHLWVGTVPENTADMIAKGRLVPHYLNLTHCKHGHPLSGDNLYMTPDGRRNCRACRREAARRYQAR